MDDVLKKLRYGGQDRVLVVRARSGPTSQRTAVLYWIASAKRPETRAARVTETVRAAAEGRGPR